MTTDETATWSVSANPEGRTAVGADTSSVLRPDEALVRLASLTEHVDSRDWIADIERTLHGRASGDIRAFVERTDLGAAARAAARLVNRFARQIKCSSTRWASSTHCPTSSIW